jgi:diguanylate cyclase (GGDEF)-like protein
VAQAIFNNVRRASDLTARYGGEEFAIVMPETDMPGALHVAERIRMDVAAMQISHSRSATEPFVTISCGVSSIVPALETSPQILIESADQALYRAKSKGRNCVSE